MDQIMLHYDVVGAHRRPTSEDMTNCIMNVTENGILASCVLPSDSTRAAILQCTRRLGQVAMLLRRSGQYTSIFRK